ncbi:MULTISPECIES: FliM/FliN family flagellar motor C-terminal domain-containing protein [unclassified Luteibacter]|uniref:FliM/FliN family flagellar motor C-terminal domain-containing protein n=1 Tax=Luteibacter sp. PvP019 TaxID=3156436 RepID=UPI003399A923
MNSVLVEPLLLEPLSPPAETTVGASIAPDLSMVGHVRVKLTAALGEADVPLSELFDLKTGHIVELDSLLDQPITLSLNGKPVATAHLVAVGDHFGVQIVKVLAQV